MAQTLVSAGAETGPGGTPISVNLSDPHRRISCDGREREWRSIVGFKLPSSRAGQALAVPNGASFPDRDFTGVCWWEGDLATGISRYMATGGHDHIKRSQADLSGVIRLKRVDNLPES